MKGGKWIRLVLDKNHGNENSDFINERNYLNCRANINMSRRTAPLNQMSDYFKNSRIYVLSNDTKG